MMMIRFVIFFTILLFRLNNNYAYAVSTTVTDENPIYALLDREAMDLKMVDTDHYLLYLQYIIAVHDAMKERQESKVDVKSKKKNACLFNGGMSQGCDFMELLSAIHQQSKFADFAGPARTHFDDCQNHLERILKSINELNAVCAEENVLNEKYSKIITAYDLTRIETSSNAVKRDEKQKENGPTIVQQASESHAEVKIGHQEPLQGAFKGRQNGNLSVCLAVKPISDDEFQTVPGYMKGRIRLAQINQVVDKFNEVLNKKYSLVEQSLKGACRENKEKYLRYKSQETSDTKHQRFCMDEDIKEVFSSKEIQTFNKQVVQILRHCKRIKEVRNGSLVRYVLLPH